jgi:hypothetical protein
MRQVSRSDDSEGGALTDRAALAILAVRPPHASQRAQGGEGVGGIPSDADLHGGLANVGGEGGLGAPRMAASGRLAIAPTMAAGQSRPDDPVRARYRSVAGRRSANLARSGPGNTVHSSSACLAAEDRDYALAYAEIMGGGHRDRSPITERQWRAVRASVLAGVTCPRPSTFEMVSRRADGRLCRSG